MKKSIAIFICVPVLLVAAKIARPKQKQPPSGPPLMFPVDYRQWVYLSSGLNMQYQGEPVLPCKEGQCPPMFENVFVPHDAYDGFVSKGVWPAGTVMVLERRCSAQKVSIDTAGSIQEKLFLEAVSQKTTENGWSYYLFGTGDLTCLGPDPTFNGDTHLPVSNSSTDPGTCWQCHRDHGAVDNTFVQFYPTLRPSTPRTHRGE